MIASTSEQQAQLEAWNRALQPFVEWLQRVARAIRKPLASLVEQLQQAGIFPKRTRRPKRRSRLRSRVALKRKGLYHASVWA